MAPAATSAATGSTTGAVLNALANPSAHGYRDGTNTGVPPGTTLTPSGSITVSSPGQIIEDLDISGGVTFQGGATNAIIRRCRIHRDPSPGFGCIRFQGGVTGVVIEDCEIFYESAAAPDSVIGGSGSYTLRRCNIWGVTEGPRVGSNCTIVDNYIHHLVRIAGGHIDVLQTTGGSNIVVHHNTLLAYNPDLDDPMNACYICKSDFANISGVEFTDNLLDGGNFTVYFNSVAEEGFTCSDVTFTGNRFGRNYAFGPVSTEAVINMTQGGNVWDDDNTPVGS